MDKICSTCKETKDASEFYGNCKSPDGLAYDCKVCHKETAKKWARDNRDRVNENRRKRYAEDSSIEKKQKRKWRLANPDKVREHKRKYHKDNKEKILETNKKWLRDNPGKKKEYKHRRRAAKSGNGGSFTAKEWKALCKKYGNRCVNVDCENPCVELTPDHVIPITWEGGTSNIDNIQPLCRSCNSSKGNRNATDYRPSYELLKMAVDEHNEKYGHLNKNENGTYKWIE